MLSSVCKFLRSKTNMKKTQGCLLVIIRKDIQYGGAKLGEITGNTKLKIVFHLMGLKESRIHLPT